MKSRCRALKESLFNETEFKAEREGGGRESYYSRNFSTNAREEREVGLSGKAFVLLAGSSVSLN